EPVRAETGGGPHRLAPRAVLRRGGRHAEVAGAREPRVDALTLAPGLDLVEAPLGDLAGPARALLADRPHERRRLLPEGIAEPAVSPARSSAAHVPLEEHDVDPRRALGEEEGAPHARVPAAQDHHVGAEI